MVEKYCTKCGEKYPATAVYFALDKRNKSGLAARCRECKYTETANSCKKKPEKYKLYKKEYQKKYHKTPKGFLARLVGRIKHRCNNKNYKQYKDYGGRGIKCCFTSDELYNWVVVNGIDPRGLEIHRIKNGGDYTLDNIKFLDKSTHAKLHNPKGIQIGKKFDR